MDGKKVGRPKCDEAYKDTVRKRMLDELGLYARQNTLLKWAIDHGRKREPALITRETRFRAFRSLTNEKMRGLYCLDPEAHTEERLRKFLEHEHQEREKRRSARAVAKRERRRVQIGIETYGGPHIVISKPRKVGSNSPLVVSREIFGSTVVYRAPKPGSKSPHVVSARLYKGA